MNSDGRRIFDIAEVWERKTAQKGGRVSLLLILIQIWRGEETHNVVRVGVLDYDALGRQLCRERLGPSANECLASRVDCEHGGRRGACKRAHVQDQALLANGYPERGNNVSACASQCPAQREREGRGTDREAIEGAMRLVMRSVAVTLTLMIVPSSSGDVSTKSLGNS
jgi:hypothetical protein